MDAATKAKALESAILAVQGAGALMRKHLNRPKKVNSASRHDLKLALDVECQESITKRLRKGFPSIPMLGEEGSSGDDEASVRWVVDPIDGTVNFAYGIPHACVSIALQIRSEELNPVASGAGKRGRNREKRSDLAYQTIVGVVYDPFAQELWTAVRGQPAKMNGKRIRVSQRARLSECMVSLGLASHELTMSRTIPSFARLVRRVRKVRIMGAAALAMVYVATGRLDAYLEYGVRLWDIAAAGLIIECAGGEFWRQPVSGRLRYHIVAHNGLLRQKLAKYT